MSLGPSQSPHNDRKVMPGASSNDSIPKPTTSTRHDALKEISWEEIFRRLDSPGSYPPPRPGQSQPWRSHSPRRGEGDQLVGDLPETRFSRIIPRPAPASHTNGGPTHHDALNEISWGEIFQRLDSPNLYPPLFRASHTHGGPTIYPSPPIPNSPAPQPEALGAHCAPVRPPAWRLNYKIGTGAYGTIFLENVQIAGMKSPELWAVKRISRTLSNFTFKQYEAEIKNLQALAGHKWFVKFNSTYQDTHCRYIAMEYIPLGDMSQSFADGYRWNESDTKAIIKQLLHGLAVMHKEGITHRDLKPENIFLYLPENQTNVLRVKIGDFGTSKRIPPSSDSTYLKTTTGTQGYMAPEVHDTSQEKTNKVDIWSLGCVLYRMSAGNLLFKDAFEVLKYSWAAPSSPLALDNIGFSIPCVSFLRSVLQPIPEDRPSAEDCLKKTWIMSQVPELEYSIGEDLYTRLSRINYQAPNVHSFPEMVANRAMESGSVP